jgi:hypothetical protein
MAQRDRILLRRAQIGIFAKIGEDGRVDILDPAPVEGDADQEPGHALGDRAQIVHDTGVEGDAPERPAPLLVLAREVVLVDEHAVPDNEDSMNIGLLPAL